MTTQRERFGAWFARYHDEACEQYGGLDCTNPQGIADDAWQEAERQMIERCATLCDKKAAYARLHGGAQNGALMAQMLADDIRALGGDDDPA